MCLFSKSNYCLFRQCPKLCWLKKYRPNDMTEDEQMEVRFRSGNEVGDLAKHLFGDDFVEVTTVRDGKLDLASMVKKTEECIRQNANVICEASFSFDGLYCAVDILRS